MASACINYSQWGGEGRGGGNGYKLVNLIIGYVG